MVGLIEVVRGEGELSAKSLASNRLQNNEAKIRILILLASTFNYDNSKLPQETDIRIISDRMLEGSSGPSRPSHPPFPLFETTHLGPPDPLDLNETSKKHKIGQL